MERQKYRVDFLSYPTNNYVKSACGDITFYNQGSTNVTINNTLVIRPGGSVSLSANAGEIDDTIYNFAFTDVPGLVNEIVIMRKIFF